MELQRSRRTLGLGIVVLVGGVLGLICAWGAVDTLSTVFYAGFAVLALALGAVLLRGELKPFRFTIAPEGLTLRDGPVPWSDVDRIVLDEPLPAPGNTRGTGPLLLLIPTGGTPSDARVILDLDDVKQSVAEVATALTEHSGGRFVDAAAERRAHLDAPEFVVTLRGYDQRHVDLLLRLAGDALRSGDPDQRRTTKDRLDSVDLPIASRGYDRAQVDRLLRTLSRKLATPRP